MFTNTNKQAKNNATNSAIQAFLENGGRVVTSKTAGKRERKGTPANYFTSKDAPVIAKVDNWETKLDKLAAIGKCIAVAQWGSDGRVANSKEELYGIAHCN